MMGYLLSFSQLSLNFQSDLLIFMIWDDPFSPILQLTDFLGARRLIPLSTHWWIPRQPNGLVPNLGLLEENTETVAERMTVSSQCRGTNPNISP